MHGVIVFSTRSGACLFARAFTDNFGLPGEWSTHGDGASTSPTGRSFGAMQLAGLLFAIRAYAEDLAVPEGRGGSKDAEERPSEGGPDRASRPGQRQNVKFVCLKDGSGFPHIFWKCIRAVPKGGALWGDYGDDFWEHKQDDDPIFAAMLRRMLYTVRGCSAAFPIPLDVEA